MTSLGAATARWAYVQCDVYEAVLVAGQKDECMCAADHERSQRRSAAVAGMSRRGSVRVREARGPGVQYLKYKHDARLLHTHYCAVSQSSMCAWYTRFQNMAITVQCGKDAVGPASLRGMQ